jgi:hypothetical protein
MAVSRRQKEQKAERRNSARAWAEEQSQGFEPTAVKLPNGVEFFKQEEGAKVVDFIPYTVTKGSDTLGGNPRADAGFTHWERTYEVHRIPGSGQFANAYCCRKACFGKKCPACEWLQANGRNADEELVRQIKNQRRHLMIVNPKPGKKDTKLMVFDCNHFNRKLGFGEQLVEAINAQFDEDDPHFTDLKAGRKVRFVIEGKYKQVPRVDFQPRSYEYPESILEHGIDLDECLIDAGYAKMQEALDGGVSEETSSERNDEDEEEERTPRKGKKAKEEEPDEDEEEPDEEPDESEEEEDEPTPAKKKSSKGKKADPTADDLGLEVGMTVAYEDMECKIVKVSPDGTSLTLKDDEGELHKAIAPDEVELLEEEESEEEEEETPAPKKGKGKKAAAVEDDDEDTEDELEEPEESEDELDDDEDLDDGEPQEEPAPKKRGSRR